VILPDVNVLLYAFRSDSREHERHRAWLEGVVNGPSAYGMSPQVLASVVRIATHPRIFVQPSSLDAVLQFSDVLLGQPHCNVIQPGSRHWDIFGRISRECRATGNLVQDAWFAALAIESGCEWVTTDRDYARFEGLRWRTPFGT
jgi:toxin-antitoxin system PIN domain toxin